MPTKNVETTIGERIAARRRELGLTQQSLAEATGIKRYDIAKIETGRRRVSATEMAFLADALDTRPEALVGQARSHPAIMFRHGRRDSEAISAAVEWLARYVEDSALTRRVLADLP